MSDSKSLHPSSYVPEIGDLVRFRESKAPEVLRDRQDAVGKVVGLATRAGTRLWPIVEFEGYLSAELAPGQVEYVGRPEAE